MTSTFTLTDASSGLMLVDALHDNVPPGARPTGQSNRLALDKLAALLEAR